MRDLPAGLQESLAGTATTIARGWRLTRRDGTVLGFTDHDEALVFAGTRFEAATGMSAGEAEASLGLAAGTQEVEGALSAASLDEDEIASGLYDGAKVESFVADWRMPERHMLLSVAEIGEIRRGGGAFTAELRGPEAALDRQRGRTYRRRCDAALGDARCGVDLATGGLTRGGVVVGGGEAAFEASGLGALERTLFGRGLVTVTSGRAAGFAREVAGLEEGAADGTWRITLAEPLPFPVAAGDALILAAGCDKSFATCRDRFANRLNFRGFPHLPGMDAALAIAKRDDLHDGSPVVA